MKKKTAILGIALAVCMAGSLAACGLSDAGKADDNFPYDIAKEQGYTGSEGSWLSETTSSTLYYRMWEEAKADGYTGSYYEFLQSLDLGDDSFYLQQSLRSAVSIVSYTSATSMSAGAGVILSVDRDSGDMDVLTNFHVVYNATSRAICNRIDVYLYGGEVSECRLKATYVYGSSTEDLALLHIAGTDTVTTDNGTHSNAKVVTASSACAVTIGDAESLLVGEAVYAIGYPEAWGLSVVEGVVSVDAEYVTMDPIIGTEDVSMLEIRTDATVNHGNSGGGLFNAAGQLVGIVNARSETSNVYGVGYAIPINHALAVLNNLKANAGKLQLARLGITVTTEESRSVYDATSGRTFLSEKVVVKSVSSGAAQKGGMDVGDTIVSMTLNGDTVQMTRQYKINNFLLQVRKGDTITVVVSRKGESVTLTIPYDRDAYFETLS